MESYSDFVKFDENKKCLDDYYYFEKVFSNRDIEKIKNLVAKSRLEDGVAGSGVDKSYRTSKISWIQFDEDSKWLYKKIGQLVNTANKEMYGFSITSMKEPIQYGEYHASDNGHYDWHLDIGGHIINRKISVTIQLSRPEEGEALSFTCASHSSLRSLFCSALRNILL